MTLLYAYNFDEASGALIDCSGAGRNVTLAGSLVRTSAGTGHTSQGLSQSTTSADSAGPAITGLQTANYTVMAWVKRTTNALDGWICELKASGSGDRGILFLGGNIQSRARNSGGTVVGASVAQPTAGTWYHVAGSYDGTTLRLFINGTQVATAALTAPLKSTSTGSHLIDALGSETVIDDVRYYDTALTAGEISTLMSTPVTGATTVTGTLAGSLPGLTSTITGAVRVPAVLDGTLPGFTSSIAATARAAGELAGSLPALTSALVGASKATGVVEAALPGFTVQAVGALKASGTISAELPGIAASFDGGLAAVSGTLTADLPRLTGQVAGGMTVSGVELGSMPGLVGSLFGVVHVDQADRVDLTFTVGPTRAGEPIGPTRGATSSVAETRAGTVIRPARLGTFVGPTRRDRG